MDDHQRAPAGRRAAHHWAPLGHLVAVIGGLLTGLVVAVSIGGAAGADLAPAVSSTTLPNTTTTLNANAGDTGNATPGTVVLIVVTLIIVVGAGLIYWRARANRLSGSG